MTYKEVRSQSAIDYDRIETCKRLEYLLDAIKKGVIEVEELQTIQRHNDNCIGMTLFYKPKERP